MKRFLLPLLAAALLLAGCGSTTHSTTTSAPSVPVLAPSMPVSPYPSSATIPDGSRFVGPPEGVFAVAASSKHISTKGLHLIENFEGFSSCPYLDEIGTGNPYTRGFGETEGIHSYSPCISREQAQANLYRLLEERYTWVLRGLPLNQNQFDALSSFIWNVGPGTISGRLREDLASERYYAASRIMLEYVYASGVVVPGLVTRRYAEVNLFLTPVAEVSRAQLEAELHYHEARRNALHYVIDVHHCRKGPPWYGHAKPRSYHTRCGIWLREGQREINAIHSLERRLK